MLNHHDLLGLALQKLYNMSLAGVPLVVCHGANNDDDLLSNTTSPTQAGNYLAILSLGKSIKNHGHSLVDIAKIDAKAKEKDSVHQSWSQLISNAFDSTCTKS